MDQDLLAYLDQRFSAIDRRFQETGQQIQELREETVQRFSEADQRLDGMDQHFEKLEGDVRGVGVSVEGLRGEIQLVAEGVTNNHERLKLHGEEVFRRFDEAESFNRRSYKNLENRVRKLEAAG